MKGGEQISFLYPRCSIALVSPKVLLPYHGNSEGQHHTKSTLYLLFSLQPTTLFSEFLVSSTIVC